MFRIAMIAMALVALGLEHAAAQTKEPGAALRRFGIAPITDVDRLVALGCRDVMMMAKSIKPYDKARTKDRLFRYYRYRGLDLTTEADEAEAIFGTDLLAAGFLDWAVFDRAAPSTDDVVRKYGAPTREEAGVLWYYSEENERATLQIYVVGGKVTRINWVCD
jgi:hypothetical protein